MDDKLLSRMPGRLLILGFGCVGQGVLPLIVRHLAIERSNILIITADGQGRHIADAYAVEMRLARITRENFRTILVPELRSHDFLLNVSVGVSTLDLIHLCRALNVFYLDTVVEPWEGDYFDLSLDSAQRTNYALRERVLEVRNSAQNGPTALIAHGANPGLISHFCKEAALHLRAAASGRAAAPVTQAEWATLFAELDVRIIHIAECDTQESLIPSERGVFVNTWSCEGFIAESFQPAELGWGTHENSLPPLGDHHSQGCGAAIYLHRPGGETRVRSWAPNAGPFLGYLITHHESISIAHYLTVSIDATATYRPTVNYAYMPCPDAVRSLEALVANEWRLPEKHRLLRDEIVSGGDELGVLLLSAKASPYWYGSQLSIAEARRLAPYNNATSLQVAAGILGGMVWALENPDRGIVEAEDIDYQRVLHIAKPYLGRMVGRFAEQFATQVEEQSAVAGFGTADPWQSKDLIS